MIIEKKREACLVMRAPESLHIYGLQNREAYFKDMCTVRDLVIVLSFPFQIIPNTCYRHRHDNPPNTPKNKKQHSFKLYRSSFDHANFGTKFII